MIIVIYIYISCIIHHKGKGMNFLLSYSFIPSRPAVWHRWCNWIALVVAFALYPALRAKWDWRVNQGGDSQESLSLWLSHCDLWSEPQHAWLPHWLTHWLMLCHSNVNLKRKCKRWKERREAGSAIIYVFIISACQFGCKFDLCKICCTRWGVRGGGVKNCNKIKWKINNNFGFCFSHFDRVAIRALFVLFYFVV